MRNHRHKEGGWSRKRIDIVLCLFLFIYPFIYGYNVLAFNKPLTAPTKEYIYIVKPVQFLLMLGIYLYAAYYANARVRGLSQIGRSLALVSSSLFAVSILILSFADIYKNLGVIGPDGEVHREPVVCLYFSVVTWTTLGYGDFRPATNDGRLFAGIEAMLGYIVMGVFIAAVGNLLFVLQQRSSTSLAKVQHLHASLSEVSTKGETPNPEPQADA
jgi:hypothetical protein